VHLPDSLTERLPFLELLDDPWQPVSIWALGSWLAFYVAFFYQLMRGNGLLLMIDVVFIPIHEGGHLLLRFFGEFPSIAGGTFLQLFVPAALAAYFVFERQSQGAAFCGFFLFEQCLPIAQYMADASAQELPLLTVGDAGDVIHDWNYLFGKMGMLAHDAQIATTVRAIGWIGMMGVVGWFVWRGVSSLRAAAAARASGVPKQLNRR
jgi:hypothetical protein